MQKRKFKKKEKANERGALVLNRGVSSKIYRKWKVQGDVYNHDIEIGSTVKESTTMS